MVEQPLTPGLYIVATPIGNLGDISARAKHTLEGAALVLAEDTRVTGKLLHHFGLKARMKPYNDHSDERLRADIVARLSSEAIALVSDAGTPLISDPGYKLVRDARAAGAYVTAVPGASALTAGLSIAGLPTDRFLFLGFLPSKAKARTDALAEVAAIRATLVTYESGPRLGDTLAAMAEALGPRDAAVLRELSKLHEEVATGTLPDLAARYASETPKGEIMIVVAPPGENAAASDDDLDAALDRALETLSPSRAAAEVATALNIPRKRAYARALERSGG